MDRFNTTIQVKPQVNYHSEQFDIYGRQERGDQPKDRERDRDRERGGGRGRERDPRGQRRQEEPSTAPPQAAAAKDEG